MTEPWIERFTAPRIADVRWAADAPHRLGVVSTESGTSQAWAWDLDTGTRRQVSDRGVGAEEVHISPDGDSLLWWLDPVGDERGRWIVAPFDGGEGEPLLAGVTDGWMQGISIVPGAVAAGIATEEDYAIYVKHGTLGPRAVYRHARPAGVGAEWPQGRGGLSADATMLCIRHAEEGDITHQALRVVDAHSGETVGELVDAGRAIAPVGWSPVLGDHRLVVIRELEGWARPWIWDLTTGTLTPLHVDAPGEIGLADWFPDGSALLLFQDHQARHQLLRFEIASGLTNAVEAPTGTISQAGLRHDGTIWIRHESGVEPPRIVNTDGEAVLTIPGATTPPGGTACQDMRFENGQGQVIQGWLIRPEGPAPHPTIVSVHGGPEYHITDAFDPSIQAYVDHGFAVLQVNYRGSTGFGTAFRETLRGNIGFPESEDIAAGVEHLVAEGISDPGALFIEGWSWGGYLATLNAGLHPDRWRAVMAGIPVGDYVAAHYESAPALRDWDLAVMGGSPMDLPELYRERNPMTYVDQVRAPMLMIAGEHDSRCPLGQVMTYAHALRARGQEVAVHLYPGGHHANDVTEQIEHVRMTLAFFQRRL